MRALIALLALTLAACGGGGGEAPHTRTIQIEGDSISVGSGAALDSSRPAALLRAACSATVIATGLSGSTSHDRITGNPIPGPLTQFPPFPVGIVGDVYLTNWGVNNAYYGLPLEQYRADIRLIASQPGAVLMTPTPIADPRAVYSTDAYAQAVIDIGKELHVQVIDVHSYVLSLPNWSSLMTDGVHPTDALYRSIYADLVIPALGCKGG